MINKLNNKELRKKINEFGKTNYEKNIFLICYLPVIISLVFTIVSFSIGNYGY